MNLASASFAILFTQAQVPAAGNAVPPANPPAGANAVAPGGVVIQVNPPVAANAAAPGNAVAAPNAVAPPAGQLQGNPTGGGIPAAATTTSGTAAAPSELGAFVSSHPNWAAAGLILTTVAIGIATYFGTKLYSGVERTDDQFRHLVAKSVLFSSIWGLISLAIVNTICHPEDSKEIFTLLLPVFGTWMGTLLAYYFGKDNYESATRNAKETFREASAAERLKSIPVLQAMIKRSDINFPDAVKDKSVAEFGTISLKTVSDQMEAMKRERLPLIDHATGKVTAVLHRSLINSYLVKKGGDLNAHTLQALLADPDAGKVASKSFVTIDSTATLADAKLKMTQAKAETGISCEDAFVRLPGNEDVIGWITNDIINDQSQA